MGANSAKPTVENFQAAKGQSRNDATSNEDKEGGFVTPNPEHEEEQIQSNAEDDAHVNGEEEDDEEQAEEAEGEEEPEEV